MWYLLYIVAFLLLWHVLSTSQKKKVSVTMGTQSIPPPITYERPWGGASRWANVSASSRTHSSAL